MSSLLAAAPSAAAPSAAAPSAPGPVRATEHLLASSSEAQREAGHPHSARTTPLNDRPARRGNYVLYWMQASMRVEHNPAFDAALAYATARNQPCLVAFALCDDFPSANLRHYRFMLEGLREVQAALRAQGIEFVVLHGDPVALIIAAASEASMVVTDCSYLRLQRAWRSRVAAAVGAMMVEIEGDVVVPVATSSSKEEYSAATLRRKLQPLLAHWLPQQPGDAGSITGSDPDGKAGTGVSGQPTPASSAGRSAIPPMIRNLPQLQAELARGVDAVLAHLTIDRSVPPSSRYVGGLSEAESRLEDFLLHRLAYYSETRSDPARALTSNLSAYLHFGQISPTYVARRVRAAASASQDHAQQLAAGAQAFLEELIVRRELAINFAYYNPCYDQFECLPRWAAATLAQHASDPRPQLYTLRQLEQAETEDPYWNAAQREMLITGTMHGYMRMYWGKRLIEWHREPREAFATAVYLNDKYQLDGRDPNGYAGVAWCFGKHDRGWPERPIFGTVRSMTAGGLRRKFAIERYVAAWTRT